MLKIIYWKIEYNYDLNHSELFFKKINSAFFSNSTYRNSPQNKKTLKFKFNC